MKIEPKKYSSQFIQALKDDARKLNIENVHLNSTIIRLEKMYETLFNDPEATTEDLEAISKAKRDAEVMLQQGRFTECLQSMLISKAIISNHLWEVENGQA